MNQVETMSMLTALATAKGMAEVSACVCGSRMIVTFSNVHCELNGILPSHITVSVDKHGAADLAHMKYGSTLSIHDTNAAIDCLRGMSSY